MQLIHLAEFAWHLLEPAAGRFEFDWLDDVLAMAHERQLEVILCTPTASPPQWLLHEQPEILTVGPDGQRQRVGGRRNYNPLSPALHEATRRIVEAMAKHFGDRNGVIGWQLDNEYMAPFDQSDVTHSAFQAWLQKKHGDLDTLNHNWGNQFWRTDYTDWQQIKMPPRRYPLYDNPHHYLDASRFWSTAWAQYNKLQCDILRPHIGDRFLTHNFMPFHPDPDPAEMAGDLDVFGIDVYPVTGMFPPYETESDLRLADPAFLAGAFADMKSQTGRWALLEVQPGQLNWSGVPVRLPPGAVRLMLWQAAAMGAEFITVYRWRNPTFGQEMHHECLIRHDGTTPTAAGEEFIQVAKELREHLPENNRTYQPIGEPDGPVIGVAHGHENLWWGETLAQAKGWNQPKRVADWFGAVASGGLAGKRVRPDASDWAGLPMVVVPSVMLVDEAWCDLWRQYVEAGGHLLATARTAWYDRRGYLWEAPTADPLTRWAGFTIDGYDGLPKGNTGQIEFGGETFDWQLWSEQLVPSGNAEVWAKHTSGWYAGAAAVVSSVIGRGRVTYCGVADSEPLGRAVFQRAAKEAGLLATPLPRRVRHDRIGGFNVAMNATLDPVQVAGRTVPPAGVELWR